MKPENLLIKEYNYHLPESKIAKYPLQNRDSSKLLIYKDGDIQERVYNCLADQLPAKSLLVFNNTRVVAVRLFFTKHAGSVIELFCLEPAMEYKDITTAMLQKQTACWKCLVGGVKKWKKELLVSSRKYNGQELILTANKIEKKSDYAVIEFNWNDDSISFSEILHLFGSIPLPPYLNRASEERDKERYQTIYARHDGSVAAPTAGLHFTEDLLNKLAAKDIKKEFVTLHVGAGTFKPVKTETVISHEMHAEQIEVSSELVEQLIAHLLTVIIAVGTTSLRTLESLYWIGVKICCNKNILPGDISLSQWEAYDLPQNIAPSEALQALLVWMKELNMHTLLAKTKILIAPGYQLRVVNALITNFHQPQSTLLLLIAAIVGDDWKSIYNYALDHHFRFLSYGDGCLLWNKTGL